MLALLLKRALVVLLLIAVGIALLLQFALRLPPWLAWPIGLALVPLLPALSTLRTFRMARARQGEGVDDDGDASWRKALRGDLLAMWRLFLWRQVFASRLPAAGAALDTATGAGRDTAAVPVLLIHGFVCNHRVWDECARHLATDGHPVWRLDLEPLFCDIDAYAPRIDAAVSAMLQAHPAHASFAIVAHSMGGLASRAWLRAHPQRLDALHALVTLGSPHRGTLVNTQAKARNARAMIYRSDWLTRLEADEVLAVRERTIAILTPQDQIVFPQREQWLPGMRVERFSGIGHLGLLSAPPVLARVAELLRRSPSERVPARE